MKKVLLTTGGTGGHIYPALSVADNLKNKGIDVVFLGSISRMEKDLVPQSGYRFIGLDIKPPRSLATILSYIKSIKSAYKIVKKENPDAIIGFGNYISVPAVLAGFLQKKKIYLQEQNANMGFANKFFYKVAKLTFLAFEKTYDDIPIKYHHKFKVLGNPLRTEINGLRYRTERAKLGINANERVLLITGGSLGAQDINNAIIKQWNNFFNDEKIRVFWATGKANYDEIILKIKDKKEKDDIKPYFDNMLSLMAASDLVLCRAGALTISEIIELEKPAILIPYNSVKVGQYENAKVLMENKSALVFTKNEIDEAIEQIFSLIRNEEELKKMRIRLKSLKKSNSAENLIANLDIWRS